MFKVLIAGEFGDLAAFFMEPHPTAALLNIVVLDLHGDCGTDAGESISHEGDEGAVAQTDQDRFTLLN